MTDATLETAHAVNGSDRNGDLSDDYIAQTLKYLATLLNATLGASKSDLEAEDSLLSNDEVSNTTQRCRRFLQGNETAIYVHKFISNSHRNGGDVDATLSHPRITYRLSSKPPVSPAIVSSVAILKHPQRISNALSLGQQLQVVNLPRLDGSESSQDAFQPENSPFQLLHSVVRSALTPYFDAISRDQTHTSQSSIKNVSDKNTGIPAAKKKLAELELSLLQLQFNAEIPHVSLPLHPAVQAAIKLAKEEHEGLSVGHIPDTVLAETSFQNSLRAAVRDWIRSIKALVETTRDPTRGSASQEINFWLDMESALNEAKVQLDHPGVLLTLKVLKEANSFKTVVNFDQEARLSETVNIVRGYNHLMRDFPLYDLLSALSLEAILPALEKIFAHMQSKWRKPCNYPVPRVMNLFEAISRDLDNRIQILVNGRALMLLSYADFELALEQTSRIWKCWDDNIRDLYYVARERAREMQEKAPIKIASHHARTQDRFSYISAFRHSHEQLRQTIQTVFGQEDAPISSNGPSWSSAQRNVSNIAGTDPGMEVSQAYSVFKDIDALDVSPEGTRSWDRAETVYNERTSRVESAIIARLRDRLAMAKNSSEMFRVFSKFNALFVRHRIRGAIIEYQSQLIDSVKLDIRNLQDRFKQQYGYSPAHAMAQIRDIPPVSGAAVWARQIERQLDSYMLRIGDVLGPQWQSHAEGKSLGIEIENFRKKLDTSQILTAWRNDVLKRDIAISGCIFDIERSRHSSKLLDLKVSFDARVITLFKEVRNLGYLGCQIPDELDRVAIEARYAYPFAVSLIDSVRIFNQANQLGMTLPDVLILLDRCRFEVLASIATGIKLKWKSFAYEHALHAPVTKDVKVLDNGEYNELSCGISEHGQFVRNFARHVELLQRKTGSVVAVRQKINLHLKSLANCTLDFATLEQALASIQTLIDQLELDDYSNLDHAIASINTTVQQILSKRFKDGLSAWVQHFNNSDVPHSRESSKTLTNDSEAILDGIPDTSLGIERMSHELCIRNQIICLEPPLLLTRSVWVGKLHDWISRLCNLSRIRLSQSQICENPKMHETRGFREILILCSAEIDAVYRSMDAKLSEVQSYLKAWFQFQSLWDLQSDQVEAAIGDNLEQWLELLHDMRHTRTTFDTTMSNKDFGSILIEYDQVQTKINAKYDLWQDDLHARFAAKLGERMAVMASNIDQARADLQGSPLDFTSTATIVKSITTLQRLKEANKLWAPEIEVFRRGQMTLYRQRFKFHHRWIFVETIENDWDALQEIIARMDQVVSAQIDGLRAKITAETRIVSERIGDITAKWNAEKPVSGSVPAETACGMLAQMESSLLVLTSEVDLLSKAKAAVGLPPDAQPGLNTLLDEVRDFKSVWTALSTVWNGLNALRDTPWSAVQPRKVKHSLSDLLDMSKEMPASMRQYAAFDHVQMLLKQLLKANVILVDLKSDAIRDRHWVQFFKALKTTTRYSQLSLTLGNVWDLRLIEAEKVVRQIIVQAQGEMALEEFLRQVREYWHDFSLDLVNYQNKCRLIRGWDDLFAKCTDHSNSLQAMKHSPYYKEFEDESLTWEDRLNRISIVFNTWVDVQRQWVYLEGVFTGNLDIKLLLPMESSRFQGINAEYLSIMKKVQRAPLILEVLNIPGLHTSLERVLDMLKKIQKALGEYLERERASFPRFYFVGDEDLLEIIGNSRDTMRVARHMGKMFAGISTLVVEEDNKIVGVQAAQGEELRLSKEISVAHVPKANEWLALLDQSLKLTLAGLLDEAVAHFDTLFDGHNLVVNSLQKYMQTYPAQITVLAGQIWWTNTVSLAIGQSASALQSVHHMHVAFLEHLSGLVAEDLNPLHRKKCEQLITEFVHQRDVIEKLILDNSISKNDDYWLLQLRYVYEAEAGPLKRLKVKMANATLDYGFEYLGVLDRLIRTPLTERCYLTMTQALDQRLGGSPYGPAGTGKTETVKSLGNQLGRFTIVFNCDDSFDFKAMGRIFLGICQVGAWGCFDEFNRLEKRILSAVSQQIQNIQLGLKRLVHGHKAHIELIGRSFEVNSDTGIFITMNPGYAGRSNLPDNLKKLFRSVAMSKPDKELIAEVTLFSQGFSKAREISKITVPFFEACVTRMSKQTHYDFGLRALKSVLISSGALKRASKLDTVGNMSHSVDSEHSIVLRSLHETINPKLLRQDSNLMHEIETQMFSGIVYSPTSLSGLQEAVSAVAKDNHLVVNSNWLQKTLQLFQIQEHHHGVMMVGGSGCGKSSSWTTLLKALQLVDGVESIHYVIDPKVMSKEALYGTLDATTREWTDGLFTGIIRKIIDSLRGESSKRHWIVFDGDVDPEWVENLNSVLDDNKILTLPNGERLAIPSNVRILFEVEGLQYATLATVSRCGMVWFNADNVDIEMMFRHFLNKLSLAQIEDFNLENSGMYLAGTGQQATQAQIVDIFGTHFGKTGTLREALDLAQNHNHIMEFTAFRALNTLFGMLRKACKEVLEYNIQHPDFPLESTSLRSFLLKKSLLAIVWSFVGDCNLSERHSFGAKIGNLIHVELPPSSKDLSFIDYYVSLPDAVWTPWISRVPSIEVNTYSVTQADVVIPTVDTVRHEDLLSVWLAEHKPLILCGPPGSGKTMTLFNALRKLPDIEVVGLNFSSATTPDLLLRSLEQHCGYHKTRDGVVLSPLQPGRWIVVFCDEINLPARDKYGSQRVISFLRQLIERNGFWKTSDMAWVTLDRIQFVGACNPPTDAGRVPLGARFLRHAPVIMVDYPGKPSLRQIYGTLIDAVMKVIPTLRGYASNLTDAMIELYDASRAKFTPDVQPHYIYSPRELTRWTRGIYETIQPFENLTVDGLVRVWAHEALRLFQDRLLAEDERLWTDQAVRRIALEHFPSVDVVKSLEGPLLFSNWLSKHYIPVERSKLREFVKARLRTFCEEEVDIPLVLYDDALDHILRIDRVFRQPQGHVILIGISGSGKTTLSKFVAWMNGIKVFQIKIHGKYSAPDFDEDLRNVLRRCGCKGEKIAFIMDESNVLDSAFLERMNTLLANAEVPGLFEGDDFSALMTACRDSAQRHGLLLDSQEELYKWFTSQIMKNLHVVFTMNPPTDGLASRAATSPALFNRCVLNWFGNWSDKTLFQVGSELTRSMDLESTGYTAPDTMPLAYKDLIMPASHRNALLNAMVFIHKSTHSINNQVTKQQGTTVHLTPRHFLDFLGQYSKLHGEKREDLEDQQRHLNVGLDKLKETVDKVRDLRRSLATKKSQLEKKDSEANEKLQKMVHDQQKAEKARNIALDIEKILEKNNDEISRRRAIVQVDLAKAEPAVLEAQKSVNNIKRQHLTEVRSMGSPPASVKLALEAVCVLLGHRVDGWKAIQSIVRRDDFIATIVTYDNEERMTPTHRAKMRRDYLSLDDFTYERVYRASKACGPLVQWVEAQVNYSEILDRIGPLREEVRQLEEQKLDTQAQAIAVRQKIEELETSISVYKREYASLIGETESIRAEMVKVQQKVDRSLQLLDSLGSERKRWDDGSKAFDQQIDTILGDTLIAAAFLTYGGYYDQQHRKIMLEKWLHHLELSGIKHRRLISMMEYLSTADERLEWQQQSLPVDELFTENAIILNRFIRYPLIIDPTGRAVEFLRNQYRDKRITVSSFLDTNFTKQLESALRFGGIILLQDAEHIDPIANHILNREYQKTGGRILVQIGKQDIDFSPNFKLLLSTRDPSAKFAPDICSRVTLVNFSITQSSLYSQSLDRVLKSERPDVDERRSNLIKLQGEFALHLRQLERRLLQALNDSKGNILDDDTIIETLENVKREVTAITAKAAEAEGVMAEVESITSQYRIIAQSCSAIFAILEHLRYLNQFYQFSLQYFSDIYQSVLDTARHEKSGKVEVKARVSHLVKTLFVTTFRRTSPSMIQQDQIILAMLLAYAAPFAFDRKLYDTLLDDDVSLNDVLSSKDSNHQALIETALRHPMLTSMTQNIDESALRDFFSQDHPEVQVALKIRGADGGPDENLRCLIFTKLLRADRLVPASEIFANEVFDGNLMNSISNLHELVDQVQWSTPIALCCSPGFDASFRVDALVEMHGARCISVAMGSIESLDSAEKAVNQAALSGSWVFLKNVHLAIGWLQNLEKRLSSLKPAPGFRLFMSLESSLKIPVNVIRMSRIMMCEQPVGIKANMKDMTSSLAERALKTPVERGRLYVLLSLLHAIVQERLRYVPTLGWSASWEFNDSDYDCALHVIDTWLGLTAGTRSNIAPPNIPWGMLRALLLNTYGGKVDSERDLQRLSRLINTLFVPESFENGFDIAHGVATMDAGDTGYANSAETGTRELTAAKSLMLPAEASWDAFTSWINTLPEREPPEWLGLPPDAEKVLLVDMGRRMVNGVKTVIKLLDENEVLMAGDGLEVL